MFEPDIQEYSRIIVEKGFSGHTSFLQQHAVKRIDDWKQGAANNDPAAQFFLALCYAHDIAAPLDSLESLRLMQLSANAGFPPAQTQLGLQFEEGRDVNQNLDEAVRWYTRSAEAGFVLAQYRLGWMYEGGRGVTQDLGPALRWYREAAEQGYVAAQFNLARMHEEGRGTSADIIEAAHWYRL
ncbi:MAG: sel1 repeat family protein, partial [Planctomycetes bacterium]|nr:sel1 repeat family protein [Planctomycetota bacterium]